MPAKPTPEQVKMDSRLHWLGAAEIPADSPYTSEGIDEMEYTHERILTQLSTNAMGITKLADRLMIAKQMVEEGKEVEMNEKLIPILTEELEVSYEDREMLYRIDAMQELLKSL